jgi:hypothetical protein
MFRDVEKELVEKTQLLRNYEKRAEEPKVLKREEYEELWKRFSETLSKEGIDPGKYRARFDELIAWNMPFSDNEAIVMEEAKSIILAEKFKEEIAKMFVKKLPPRPTINWKYIKWGIGAMKVDIGIFKDAANNENPVQAYKATKNILETAKKLLDILKRSKDVKLLKLEA